MSQPRDILALEPFYGGARKAMLEAMSRCSRHRWTIFKLPPRRMERRLAGASHWFAEQMSRHWVGNADLVFVSEALNLVDFKRLMPSLASKPSVVYFHANQLTVVGASEGSVGDGANLASAFAATELWFNSNFNKTCFLDRAEAVVRNNPEVAQSPVGELGAKCRQVVPPTDFAAVQQATREHKEPKDIRLIFIDAKSANFALLNEALHRLTARGETFKLLVLGTHHELDKRWPVETVSESDEAGLLTKIQHAATAVATQHEAPWDYHLLMAMSAGCVPLAPVDGAYRELLPASIHDACLYPYDAENLANRLQDRWHTDLPANLAQDVESHLHQFNLASTCKVMDDEITRVIDAQRR